MNRTNLIKIIYFLDLFICSVSPLNKSHTHIILIRLDSNWNIDVKQQSIGQHHKSKEVNM